MGRRRPRSGIAGFPDRGGEDDGRVRKLALHGGDDARVGSGASKRGLPLGRRRAQRAGRSDSTRLYGPLRRNTVLGGRKRRLKKGPSGSGWLHISHLITIEITSMEIIRSTPMSSPLRRYAPAQLDPRKIQSGAVSEHIRRYRTNQSVVSQVNLSYVRASEATGNAAGEFVLSKTQICQFVQACKLRESRH